MKHSELASEHGFISCVISLKNELCTCYIWSLSLPVLAYISSLPLLHLFFVEQKYFPWVTNLKAI